MKRIVLLVFFCTSFVGAMEQVSLPEKIHLRVIAQDRGSINNFWKCVRARLKPVGQAYRAQGLSKEEAGRVLDEYISSEFESKCGLMQAFVGDRCFIERCMTDLKALGFVCLSHDRGANYERCVFTNSDVYYTAHASMPQTQKPRKSLKRKREGNETPSKQPRKTVDQHSPTRVVPTESPQGSVPTVVPNKSNGSGLHVATPNGCASETIAFFYRSK